MLILFLSGRVKVKKGGELDSLLARFLQLSYHDRYTVATAICDQVGVFYNLVGLTYYFLLNSLSFLSQNHLFLPTHYTSICCLEVK